MDIRIIAGIVLFVSLMFIILPFLYKFSMAFAEMILDCIGMWSRGLIQAYEEMFRDMARKLGKERRINEQ